MSIMVSFVLSFFPRDVLDEILNLIGSVSEGFPSYSWTGKKVFTVLVSKIFFFFFFVFLHTFFIFSILIHIPSMGRFLRVLQLTFSYL